MEEDGVEYPEFVEALKKAIQDSKAKRASVELIKKGYGVDQERNAWYCMEPFHIIFEELNKSKWVVRDSITPVDFVYTPKEYSLPVEVSFSRTTRGTLPLVEIKHVGGTWVDFRTDITTKTLSLPTALTKLLEVLADTIELASEQEAI